MFDYVYLMEFLVFHHTGSSSFGSRLAEGIGIISVVIVLPFIIVVVIIFDSIIGF